MKLNAAADLFKSLIAETNHKSEIKVYENFIGILTDLNNRKLNENQLESMEEKLDLLDLKANPENRKKYYRRKLNEFKKFLKEEFSLISEGYHTAVGIALGVAFGAAFGSMFGMGVGVALGMVIGLVIGATMDSVAKKQNRVLNPK